MVNINNLPIETGNYVASDGTVENLVDLLGSHEPAPQVLELLCEELDGFSDEVVEEGAKYEFNVIGYDGEDVYDIYFDLPLNPAGTFENILVTKDGQSASSANMFMRIFSDADPIDIPTSELTIMENEDVSWQFEWTSANGYAGNFSVEDDPDSESGVRLLYGEATKDGEVIGSGFLLVKAEVRGTESLVDEHNILNTQPAKSGNMVASDGTVHNIIDLIKNFSVQASSVETTSGETVQESLDTISEQVTTTQEMIGDINSELEQI